MPTNNDYLNTQRQKEYSAEIETNRSSLFAPIAAGLGAIVLGLNIFGKTKGRGLIADVIHFLGHPSHAGLSSGLDKLAKSAQDFTSPTTTKTAQSIQYNAAKNKVELGSIDLIDDLKNTLEILGSTRVDVASKIAARTIEKINRDTTKFGPYSSFYGPQLKRVTAGDLLSDKSIYKESLSKEQLETLQRARTLNLITDNTILDKDILRNASGDLRDVRLSRMFKTGKSGGLIGRFTGGLDLFGQASVLRSIRGTNVGVAVLGPTDYVKGNRFFIGGNVYAYDKWGQERLLATNQKLRLSGDPLDAVTAARQGNLRISKDKLKQAYDYRKIPKGLKESLIALEESTGVGLGFANRPSIIDRFIVNPFLRFKALAEGQALVYRHNYIVEGHSSKLLDIAVGSDIPELITNRGVIRKVAGGGTEIDWASMPMWQKLAAVFDLQSGISVIKKSSFQNAKTGKKAITLSNKDLVVPLPEGGLENLTKSIKGRLAQGITHSQVGIVTQAGDFVNVVRPKYYNVERSKVLPFVTNLLDTANYLFYRTNSLASETLLGIGFAPGKTPLGSAVRLASIPFLYEAGRELFEYGDYLSEKITGISPSKLLSDVYAGFRLGQQRLRETLGIQQSLSWLETNFPGSVNSEGSFILRSIVAPLAIAVGGVGKAGVRGSVFTAGLLALAVGGPSPGQTSKELEEEYKGERKVPVRKGRFWGSGFSPFFGSHPEYFDYSWYYKLKNDLSYRGLYGSKDEYFQYHQNVFGVPLPTPTNYFGLSNLANPYRWEQNNYYSRPYVQTGSPLENFPIFGPLLSATIGQALKPVMTRPSELPLLRAGLVDKGLQPSTAQMLGVPPIAASEQQIEDPNDPIQRLKKMGDVAMEPFGVYKFVMEYFGASLSPSGGPRYASSDVATSEGRQFYGQGLGGGLYQTEFLRRFMLSEYSTTHNLQRLLNPIKNQMPSFLPGSFSDNVKDRTYMKDFHMGDPFLLIQNGEYRLPGKLYEEINKLHSGTPGVYDYLDQFLILADVAPYSDSYRRLEKQVKDKLELKQIEPEWEQKVFSAMSQRKQVIGVDSRYPRIEDQLVSLNEGIKQEAMSSSYVSARKAYDFLTHDVLAEIPYVGSKLFPFRSPYEQYRKQFVEGAEYADWDRPYESIIRPMYYDMALEDPLTAGVKGGIIGALMYGPMRFFVPFMGVQTNLSKNVLFGSAIGAAASTERILGGKSENYIPRHVVDEANFYEYTDKFTYLKARMYEEEARRLGESQAASQFSKIQRKTMVGANNSIMMKAALPRSVDRRYFDYFASQEGFSEAQLNGLPEYMASALEKAYTKDFPSKEQSDQDVVNYFSVNPLPSTNFIGWHPSVPSQAVKMKLVQHGLNGVSDNMHRFGFFESQQNELENRLPDLHSSNVSFVQPIKFNSISNTAYLLNDIKSNIRTSLTTTPYRATNDVTVSRNRTYYLEDLMR